MHTDKIVFTLEFSDDGARNEANDLLQKGWILIHVGTKLIDILENGQAYYNTAYVVGATREQYQAYSAEEENPLDSDY